MLALYRIKVESLGQVTANRDFLLTFTAIIKASKQQVRCHCQCHWFRRFSRV